VESRDEGRTESPCHLIPVLCDPVQHGTYGESSPPHSCAVILSSLSLSLLLQPANLHCTCRRLRTATTDQKARRERCCNASPSRACVISLHQHGPSKSRQQEEEEGTGAQPTRPTTDVSCLSCRFICQAYAKTY
jgi:hypothetical protein